LPSQVTGKVKNSDLAEFEGLNQLVKSYARK